MPEALDRRLGLYWRELGAGSLNRLLLLHSVMSSSLRVSPPRGPSCHPASGRTLTRGRTLREPPNWAPEPAVLGQPRQWLGFGEVSGRP